MDYSQQQLDSIATQIAIDIDNWCDKKWPNENRSHLGASLIGHECRRKLWFTFRWCLKPKFSPRMKRLFNRGHLEEHRMVEYLRGMGCEVRPFDSEKLLILDRKTKKYRIGTLADVRHELDLHFDENVSDWCIKDAKKQGVDYPVQWRISSCKEHFGGSLDGIVKLPPKYGIDEEMLLEFKTSNDRGFKELLKKGMPQEKPLHWAQICTYGYFKKFRYVLYICACKNDDDLYITIRELNHKTGEVMERRAESIIFTQEPPPKLYEDPTYLTCKICEFFPICHGQAPIDRNCRSCRFARPVDKGEWLCEKYNQIIPKNEIKNEFQCWESIY